MNPPRKYTDKKLNKDIQFIELESSRRDPRLAEDCGTLTVRIRVPYNPNLRELNDQPERVIRAFMQGCYDLEAQAEGDTQ